MNLYKQFLSKFEREENIYRDERLKTRDDNATTISENRIRRAEQNMFNALFESQVKLINIIKQSQEKNIRLIKDLSEECYKADNKLQDIFLSITTDLQRQRIIQNQDVILRLRSQLQQLNFDLQSMGYNRMQKNAVIQMQSYEQLASLSKSVYEDFKQLNKVITIKFDELDPVLQNILTGSKVLQEKQKAINANIASTRDTLLLRLEEINAKLPDAFTLDQVVRIKLLLEEIDGNVNKDEGLEEEKPQPVQPLPVQSIEDKQIAVSKIIQNATDTYRKFIERQQTAEKDTPMFPIQSKYDSKQFNEAQKYLNLYLGSGVDYEQELSQDVAYINTMICRMNTLNKDKQEYP
jgi:hypothetical protein